MKVISVHDVFYECGTIGQYSSKANPPFNREIFPEIRTIHIFIDKVPKRTYG
jgi:hypothetical protein